MIKTLGYFITFVLNLIVAYFIYDQSSYVKPLLQSIFIVALIVIMDLITKKKNEKHK